MQKFTFICLLSLLLSSACVSYEDLNDMRTESDMAQIEENLDELIEILNDPCEDPDFYAQVMQVSYDIHERNNLAVSKPFLSSRLQKTYLSIVSNFDMSEIDEWESPSIKEDKNYLQTLAMQLMLQQRDSLSLIKNIKRVFPSRRLFSANQLLLWAKAIHQNSDSIKNDIHFCNDYLAYLIKSRLPIKPKVAAFLNNQLASLLNENSTSLLALFGKQLQRNDTYLNTFLNYLLKNKVNFSAYYSQEQLLCDLNFFHFTAERQIKLRDNLYLKFLNFEKINRILATSANTKLLSLNDQLLHFRASHKSDESLSHRQDNFQLLFALSRSPNKHLSAKAKEILSCHTPLSYCLSLTQVTHSDATFDEIIALTPVFKAHLPYIKQEKETYLNKQGRSFYSPHKTTPKFKQLNQQLLAYFDKRIEPYCRQSFASENLQAFTKTLQAYHHLELDLFNGDSSKVDFFRSLLKSQEKKIHRQLLPSLWSFNQSATLKVLITHLNESQAKKFEIDLIGHFYNKAQKQDKQKHYKAIENILRLRILHKDDLISLETVKQSHKFKFLSPLILKSINQRWPHFQAQNKE